MSGGREALRLLGLARRAGAVAHGTDATRRAVREGRARLVVTAGDASGTQMRKLQTTLGDRPIPQVVLGDRSALGAAIGSAPVSALAVTAESFASRLAGSSGAAADTPGEGREDGQEACGS